MHYVIHIVTVKNNITYLHTGLEWYKWHLAKIRVVGDCHRGNGEVNRGVAPEKSDGGGVNGRRFARRCSMTRAMCTLRSTQIPVAF